MYAMEAHCVFLSILLILVLYHLDALTFLSSFDLLLYGFKSGVFGVTFSNRRFRSLEIDAANYDDIDNRSIVKAGAQQRPRFKSLVPTLKDWVTGDN